MARTRGIRFPDTKLTLVERFDRVFWFGDLNYRINGNRKMVEDLIRKAYNEVLVANDQLMTVKREGKVFRGFLEGALNFLPTYKFDDNCDVYDTSPKGKTSASQLF